MQPKNDHGKDVRTFAVLGDLHGHFDRAVELLQSVEAKTGLHADFVLQVGDLEAHRTIKDTESMYAPHRLKQVGDFPPYGRKEKTFPTRMVFIGGNHEPYQRLQDSSHDAEIATNIHFLGRSGEVTLQGLKIAYLTGIFDEVYFHQSPDARRPVRGEQDFPAQRFLSCFTETEVNVLYNVTRPDVLLVHEWPSDIVRLEDHESLEPRHRHLRYGETGISVIRQLAEKLKPKLLFCGHMHRRYQGCLRDQNSGESMIYCLGKIDDSEDGIEFFCYSGDEIWRVNRQ